MSNRIEKTISFRAEDNGTSQVINKLRRETTEYSEMVLKNALAQSKNGKDFVKNIEDQIRALQQRQKLVREINAETIKDKYSNAINDNNNALNALKQERSKGSTRISSQDIAEAEQRTKNNNKLLEQERDNEIRDSSREDNIQILLLRELIQAVRDGADDEIAEDRKQAERNVLNDRRGRLEDEDTDVRANARFQRERLGDGNDEKGKQQGWFETFKALVAHSALKWGLNKVEQGANALASGQTGEFIAAKLWGVLPGVGDAFAAAQERHLEITQQQQTALGKLRGTTGIAGEDYLHEYGYDKSETATLKAQLAAARGKGGPNLLRNTSELLGISQGYNIDQGKLLGMTSMENASNKSTMNIFTNLINTLKSGGNLGSDTSSIAKLLEAQIGIMQEQSGYLENTDSEQIAQVINGFSNLGGSYADPSRMGARMNQINGSLKGADNDYQQAMNYAVLSKLNPNASFLEIKKMEEKGLEQKGFLTGTLGLIEQQAGGNDDNGAMLVQKRLGLSAASSEYLYKNRHRYSEETLVSKIETEETVKSRGIGNISKKSQDQAAITDAFGEDMWKGLKLAGGQVADEIAGKLIDITKDEFLFKSIGKSIALGIKEQFGTSTPIKPKH